MNYIFIEFPSINHAFNDISSFLTKFYDFLTLQSLHEQPLEVFIFNDNEMNSKKYFEFISPILAEKQQEIIQKNDIKSFSNLENLLIDDNDKMWLKFINQHKYQFKEIKDNRSIELSNLLKQSFANIKRVKNIGLTVHPINQYDVWLIMQASINAIIDFSEKSETRKQYQFFIMSTSKRLSIIKNAIGVKINRNKDLQIIDPYFFKSNLAELFEIDTLNGAIEASQYDLKELFRYYDWLVSGNQFDGKIPNKSFGIKKFNNLCYSYISPKHLLSIYDEISDKKIPPKNNLEMAKKLVEAQKQYELDLLNKPNDNIFSFLRDETH